MRIIPFIYLFIYLFLAVLGLRFCARAFSSCGKRGPLFIAVRGPLTIAAPPVAGHRLQTRRLSSCGSRAQLLRSMWDLPRPGLEPVSPALAGRFSTTAPPGKPYSVFKKVLFLLLFNKSFNEILSFVWKRFVLSCSDTECPLDIFSFSNEETRKASRGEWILLSYFLNLIIYLFVFCEWKIKII